jgi:metallo-beta-lactamase class B
MARTISTILLLLTCFTRITYAQHPTGDPEWVKPYKPFRIVGNLYYVGTSDLACYLITTQQGHILINQGVEKAVPQLQRNVEKLGFRFSDIRILLNSQAHFDHVGGTAQIQKLTGARIMADAADVPVMEDGGVSDYALGGHELFTPLKVDRLLHDKDTISLGGMQIVMLHHPGHTKGSCSYVFDVKDGAHIYKVLIANMPTIIPQTNLAGMPGYPDVAKDYAYTLNSLKHQQFDIWLAAHTNQFYPQDVRKESDGYRPAAFADKKRYMQELDELEAKYNEKLSKDK